MGAAPAARPSTKWVSIATVGQEPWLTVKALGQIVETFNRGVHPEAPGELPVTYHCDGPTTPDSRKAAGWIESLQVRDAGTRLWARVRWTKPATLALANREYRYVSGMFARTWRTFRGRDLGVTFLGAQLTNYAPGHVDAIAASVSFPSRVADPFDTAGLERLTREIERQRV